MTSLPILIRWWRGGSRISQSFILDRGKCSMRRGDHHVMRWARRKYKRLKGSGRKARAWLTGIRARDPELFAHWKLRY